MSKSFVIFAAVIGIFNLVLASQANAAGKEKMWIVLNFKTSEGTPAEMAFDNPSVSDITLEECKATLPKAIPNLMNFVRQEPKLANAQLLNARCVQSADDPIKP